MDEGAAIVVAVAALAVVILLNNRTAQQTAVKVNTILATKAGATLGAGDLFGIGITAAATAAGGPKAGLLAAQATGVTL
jgi:hypothetical protein